MSVIYCRKEHVTQPFYIESLNVYIYSSQELAYVLYHNPLLAMDGFIDRSLIDFIRDQLNMGFTALKLERMLSSGGKQDEMAAVYLQECDYYTTAEINKLRQAMSALRKLPALEFIKRMADYYFGLGQYGKALSGYKRILEAADGGRPERNDAVFMGKVWNNLGCCYAGMFRFDKAMEAYGASLDKKKEEGVLKKMYFLTKMDGSLALKDRYGSMVTQESRDDWDKEFAAVFEAAGTSEEAEKVEEILKKDSIRRVKEETAMVADWKRQYRGMVQ